MAKKAKVVDPLAEVKANPEKVTHLTLNPAAARNTGAGIYEALPAFPDEIFACANLVELDIFRGIAAHSKIPRELGTLRTLTSLSLGGLGFKQLPDELGDLERLEKLSLPYTESLATLPRTIGKLSKLRELSAPFTGLKSLPAEIGALGELRVLAIGRSPLCDVPPELWRLTRLETLALPEGIEVLPPGIGALTKLTTLTLSAKALASVAGELAKLRGLRVLHLIGKASTLPDEISGLLALEELHAGHVELVTLPASLGKLAKLALLDVGGNKLASLIDLLARLPALAELVAGGNPIPVAERRELDKLMKLPPSRRAAALAKRSSTLPPVAKAGKPAVKRAPPAAKPEVLGELEGVTTSRVTTSLAMVIGDARIVAGWTGVGTGRPDGSDWDRARLALAKRDAAMIDLGSKSALAMSLSGGRGVVQVFRIADRIIGVEATVQDAEDERFLAWVASPSSKPRSAAILAIPSGKLAIVPTTDPGDHGLVIAVSAKVAISIEPLATAAWGTARRFFITPA